MYSKHELTFNGGMATSITFHFVMKYMNPTIKHYGTMDHNNVYNIILMQKMTLFFGNLVIQLF